MTDMALDALLKSAKNVAPELAEIFLKECYQIEREHQFSKDRDEPVKHLQKLIEGEILARTSGDN